MMVEALESRLMLAPFVEGVDHLMIPDLLGHHGTLTFQESIDPSTLTVDDLFIAAPDQTSVDILSIAPVGGSANREFDFLLPVSTPAAVYAITVGPNIADPAGDLMDQDGDGTGGEPIEDQFHGQFQIADSVPGWSFGIEINTGAIGDSDIGIGPDGHIYVSGNFSGTVDFDPGPDETWLTSIGGAEPDGFVAKYTRDQQLLWARSFGGDGAESAKEVEFDATGNIYISGDITSTSAEFGTFSLSSLGSDDAFVAKMDADGTFLWAHAFGSTLEEALLSMSVADNGDVFLGGWFHGTVDFDPGNSLVQVTSAGDNDGFVSKFDQAGNFQWVWTYGGTAADGQTKIDIDATGNVYVAGKFLSTVDLGQSITLTSAGDQDSFVAKLDSGGTELWARHFSSPDIVHRPHVAADGNGNVFVTGYFQSSVDLDTGAPTLNGSDDSFVMRLDSDNNVQWVQQITTLSGKAKPTVIELDGLGNPMVGAWFNELVDVDPGPGEFIFRELDQGNDQFLIGLDASFGALQWAHQFSSTGEMRLRGIAMDAAGSVFTNGASVGLVVAPSGELIGAGSAFVTRLDLSPTVSVVPIDNHITTENGSQAQFGVVLSSTPTADVTVSISSSDTSEGIVDVTSLTFTPSDWDIPQSVTVTGVDDALEDGDVQFHVVFGPAMSSDPVYNGLDAPDVLFINADDEVPFQPTIEFSDSFENGQWNNLWVEDGQNDWFTSAQRSTDGYYSAEVDGRATDATLTVANPIEMSAYATAEVTFDWYIESGFDSGEYVKLDFWNGSTWNEILSLDGNQDPENTWLSETVQLDSQYLISDFRFRYRAKVSRSNEDANVDNVVLTGTSLAGPPNQDPIADAGGPYTVDEGSGITLDASGSSDSDGTIVSYQWDLDNDGQYDDATGITTSFSSNFDGVYTIGLRVIDDQGATATTSTSVTVNNLAPTANAGGPYTGDEGSDITLDASASSDPASDIVSYDWDLDNDGQYDDASGISVNFNSTDDGSFTVGLRVTDDAGATSTDTAQVAVNNVAPTADAGGPYATETGQDIVLSAAGSTDPGNDIASYDWDLDNDGQYDDASGVSVVYNNPDAGSYTVGIRVTDDDGASTTDSATVTVTAPSTGPNLAHGVVSGVSSSGWTTVNLAHTYTSMVVVATANYDSNSGPGVVRVQNASGSSFQMMVQAAGGAALSGIDVHYIVMEEGVYDEAGYKLEAVKFTSTVTDENNSWVGQQRSYQQGYTAPVVVGQVMSYNDSDWSGFWSRGGSRTSAPTATSLWVGKMVGEDSDNTRADEIIGYFVIETSTSGTAEIEGLPYVAALGGDSIKGVGDSPSYNYTYSAMPNSKTAVVSMAGMDGANGGWAILYGNSPITPTGNTLKLAIDEDQSNDSERKHTHEQVAYFIIDPPKSSENPGIETLAYGAILTEVHSKRGVENKRSSANISEHPPVSIEHSTAQSVGDHPSHVTRPFTFSFRQMGAIDDPRLIESSSADHDVEVDLIPKHNLIGILFADG